MPSSRRRFLRSSLASSTLVAMGATTIPGFLGRSALAARTGKPNERILVVVQLLGGNDGLNTVVPHGIAGYNRGRRALRLSPSQVHKITPEVGLHPAMGAMAKLLEDLHGNVAADEMDGAVTEDEVRSRRVRAVESPHHGPPWWRSRDGSSTTGDGEPDRIDGSACIAEGITRPRHPAET